MSDEQNKNTAPFKRCYKCGNKSRRGVIFCEICGAQIGTGISAEVTRSSGANLMQDDEEDTIPTQAQPGNPIDVVTQTHQQHNIQPNETFKTQKLGRGYQPGTCVFRENMMLRLEALGIDEPILLRPFEEQPIVLGRYDKDGDFQPDVDLRPFGGHKQGISRRHAAITRSGKRLFIHDLNSSNGTHINNVMLDVDEPHQLRDKDEIRLGNLVLHVTFQV